MKLYTKLWIVSLFMLTISVIMSNKWLVIFWTVKGLIEFLIDVIGDFK